jgi:hypothetical protein
VLKGVYPDKLSKIWLAINAYQEAKTQTVHEEGIGEELSFNLLGWTDDRLTVSSKIKKPYNGTQDEKFLAILASAEQMRRHWSVTGFTFMSEGYCCTNPGKADPTKPLSQQFAENNPYVIEALIFVHTENEETTIISTPYTYQLKRKVAYSDAILMHTDTNSRLPLILHSIIENITPEDNDYAPDEIIWLAVADLLEDHHIDINWF